MTRKQSGAECKSGRTRYISARRHAHVLGWYLQTNPRNTPGVQGSLVSSPNPRCGFYTLI